MGNIFNAYYPCQWLGLICCAIDIWTFRYFGILGFHFISLFDKCNVLSELKIKVSHVSSAALPHCSILDALGGWEENREEDMGHTDPLHSTTGLEVCSCTAVGRLTVPPPPRLRLLPINHIKSQGIQEGTQEAMRPFLS